MKIATVLDLIDLGGMALPEFQRGYVWNRDQVRGLMQSLYRRYPVGSLLVLPILSYGPPWVLLARRRYGTILWKESWERWPVSMVATSGKQYE